MFRTPSIAAWIVLVFLTGVFALGGNILGLYAAKVPPVAWVVIGTVATVIMAMGGIQALQNAGAKGATQPAGPGKGMGLLSGKITVQDQKLMEALLRDTKPGDPPADPQG